MKTDSAPTRVETLPLPAPSSIRFTISVADAADRDRVTRLRHEVYARELGQHAVNPAARLRDALDDYNVLLVARAGGTGGDIAGFISITPPGRGPFSIDKYFARSALPFAFDSKLYEVRILTVLKPHRGRELATLLMFAALRWVESHGGTRIVAIGRREIVDLYLRVGLRAVGLSAQSGAVTYDLLHARLDELPPHLAALSEVFDRLEEHTDWQLPFAFRKPAACFHGGAFFHAIGERFDHLDRSATIINADVLDAWFPPAPGVLDTLHENLPWLLRTSPPTACAGLIETIAKARGVTPENILPGAGSSDLIFRALRHWLTPASQVLILDPTYGEYAHVLERVIGCTVDRLALDRAQNYEVNLAALEAALADHYDLVVLVNPNSPTGRHIPRAALEALLRRAPQRTRIWIDETYIEYAAPSETVGAALRRDPSSPSLLTTSQSLEHFAAHSENIIVCKSMSKVYALSGARVAYLCAGAHQLESLRAITPPWIVGLPAQVAAVRALQDPAYYSARYAETAALRESLATALRAFHWDVLPGIANFLLCHLPPDGPDAATLVERCRAHGLFLRDASSMSPSLGAHTLRLAVKDAATNARMIGIIRHVLDLR